MDVIDTLVGIFVCLESFKKRSMSFQFMWSLRIDKYAQTNKMHAMHELRVALKTLNH